MSADLSPAQRLRSMANGYQVSQALHVAVRLGISDRLASEALTVAELATATATHEPSLARLMRALVEAGVYSEDRSGRLSNTELGEQMRSDSPGSLAGWLAFIGRPPHWVAWAGLIDSIRTGQNAFRMAHGMSGWEYRQARPEEQAIFDGAMAANTASLVPAVLGAYDFGRFERVVDVGGGSGTLLAEILRGNPRVHGVLFDQPQVVTGVGDVFERAGVAARVEVVGGSFFESVPVAGDAYVLKAVIHDWEDAESVAILRMCRRAMREDGSVLLVERLLDRGPDTLATALSDLNMLVAPGGRERTEEQYRGLFDAAEMDLAGITPTGTPFFVIEGRPRTDADRRRRLD